VFGELQTALNRMWEVKPKPGRGVGGFLRDRFLSFTMVLSVAFLLMVSLLISTALAAAGRFFADALPGGAVIWEIVNFLIQLVVIGALFALVFKVVPDVEIGWRDVWVGAAGTAVLFSIGKWALAMYLGRSSVASSYGAAGSVVALVVWVYYASQILFMGAEFTQVYARQFGSRIRPSANAVFAPAPSSAKREQATDDSGAPKQAGAQS
jgi:membrane protein